MGRVGRFVCLSVPLALTFASLVALIVVITGGVTNKSYYFFKIDTSNLTISSSLITRDLPTSIDLNPTINLLDITPITDERTAPTLTKKSIESAIASATGLESSGDSFTAKSLGLADWYTVALWNYCAVDNSTSGTNSTCSSPKAEYWFDPYTVWGISNNTALEKEFPSEVKSALKTYKKVSKWTFIVYIIAVVSTFIELLVSAVAMFCACNGCLTWIVSTISSITTIAASVMATAMSSVVVGALDSAFKSYGIKSSLGTNMLAATWLAVAFNIAAGLFLMLANCCCCGQTSSPRGRGNRGFRGGNDAEKMLPTRGYQPVGEPTYAAAPYAQQPTVYNPPTQQGYAMQPVQGAHMSGAHARDVQAGYEPYRHEQI